MHSFTKIYVALAAAAGVSASLEIYNKCSQEVYVSESHAGGANKTPNSSGQDAASSEPWTIAPGQKADPIIWNTDGESTSIKIARDLSFAKILQFEYTMVVAAQQLYWDLSNLDGDGPGKPGSPFWSDNVISSPSGSGVGKGTCEPIKCKANQVCTEAYQHPDDTATRECPSDTGTMTLVLCESDDQFNTQAVPFQA